MDESQAKVFELVERLGRRMENEEYINFLEGLIEELESRKDAAECSRSSDE